MGLALQQADGLAGARLLVVGRDQHRDGDRAGVAAGGLSHHDLRREWQVVGDEGAAVVVADPALEERDTGGRHEGETDGGEQDLRGGGLGVVDDLPDPEEEPVGRAAGGGRSRQRERESEEQRAEERAAEHHDADGAVEPAHE
ncbi:MAG: hypothetical protein WAV00_01005, partial [Nocardioides sp.]